MNKYFLMLSVSAIMCGCYSPRYVYSPSTQNLPLLHKKNDFQLAAFYAGSIDIFNKKGNYNGGFDVQSAWAVTNHFAIMLNESARWEKNGGNDSFFAGDSSLLSYKKNFTEAGAGYFTSGKEAIIQFQVFGGVAFGISKIFDDFISNNGTENKYHYSNVTKIFIQPAVVYSPSKSFASALSSRFTQVIFKHIRTNYSSAEQHNYLLDSINVSPVYFWEPAVAYTFSFKKFPLKLQVQGSLTVLINHRFVEHRNGNAAIGLLYNFSKFKENKKQVSNK